MSPSAQTIRDDLQQLHLLICSKLHKLVYFQITHAKSILDSSVINSKSLKFMLDDEFLLQFYKGRKYNVDSAYDSVRHIRRK